MMKKLLLFSLLTFSFNFFAQNCGDTIYDSGGADANYSSDEDSTFTICPTNPGQSVVVNFLSFNTEDGYDSLTVYNGNSTAAPILGIFQGTVSPGQIFSTSPDGCLTFVFTSDGSVTRPGWEALVTCEVLPSCAPPTNVSVLLNSNGTPNVSFTAGANQNQWIIEYDTLGFALGNGNLQSTSTTSTDITNVNFYTNYQLVVYAICAQGDTSFASLPATFTTGSAPLECGNKFYDNGGPNNDYNNSSSDTTVICRSNNDETLMVSFNSFFTEDGYDSLMVYEGNSVNGTLIGTYQGEDTLGVITSSTGCLTFVFESDNSVNEFGWDADIICTSPASIVEEQIENIKVYPNPSSKNVTIHSSNKEELAVEIMDIYGKKVMETSKISQNIDLNLNIENLKSGIYIIKFNSNNATFTKQLQIIK